MNRLKMPIVTEKTILAMEDMSYFVHALIFDDLLVVAQKETNCFVLKTEEGLIIIDAIWPSAKAYEAIFDAIRDVGWNTGEIKLLLLTHGHVDHTGCGKWFVENHHVKTYLSQTDAIFWWEHPIKPDRPETWKDFDIDVYLRDGDTVTLGSKTIYAYLTPGHTPGCMSYVFSVVEDGITHMAAILGGATPPWTREGTEQYLESLDYFRKKAAEKEVDVALCNHTAIDCGLERIEYSKNRLAYMPNIYILGQDGFQKFCQVFQDMGMEMLKRLDV